ncbi:MAG TPA: hypothetical protein VG734_05595 [Lacunisphaera sp.]|nr:hypothetical protein [Lacunisphaera sp.]
MSLHDDEYVKLVTAIEKALGHFDGRPIEPGFDQDTYDDLRRVREMLLRGRRDSRDPNLKHDSQFPSGPA